MEQKSFKLRHLSITELCDQIKSVFSGYSYDLKKHGISLLDDHHDIIGFVRLPLHISISKELEVIEEEVIALYLSIESGYAALCVMEGEDNVYHTTFSAYMTRKKQGFSQIKYLNKKGKSRAGSRMRLAGTTEFFEKINHSLIELFEEFEVDKIALNCTKTLIPYLYQSKVACPFEKNDERLYKIPLHIPQSNFTNLQAAIDELSIPVLFYTPAHAPIVADFLEGFDLEDDEI